MPKKKIKHLKRNHWKSEEEDLLKKWAEKAKCYQWLHNRSREIYQRKNAFYTIPVIIISTVTGTINFAQERFSDEVRNYVVIIIGALSIIAGIITTVYQFLKISEINEGHRVALISWGKYSRNLESELTRHPLDRTEPSELIKLSKEEFNRLVEISPFISKNVLKEFNTKFKNNLELTKPEIGNTINEMIVFKMDRDERQKMVKDLNSSIIDNNNTYNKKVRRKTEQINNFSDSFKLLNNRNPTKNELSKHMKYIYKEYTSNSDIDSDNSIDVELGSTNTDSDKSLNSNPNIDNKIDQNTDNNINIEIKDIKNEDNTSDDSEINSVKISKKSFL